MSALAQKLSEEAPDPSRRQPPGPSGACKVYGDGDLEDWAEIERIRLIESWMEAQRKTDRLLGFESSIDNDTFRRHWRGKCAHWTMEQKAFIRAHS